MFQFESDEYVEVNANFLIRKDQTKRIKVTCKCGHVDVFYIPKLANDTNIIPVIPCEACEQEYVIYNKKFVRIENFKTINGELLPSELLNNESWKRKPRQKEN